MSLRNRPRRQAAQYVYQFSIILCLGALSIPLQSQKNPILRVLPLRVLVRLPFPISTQVSPRLLLQAPPHLVNLVPQNRPLIALRETMATFSQTVMAVNATVDDAVEDEMMDMVQQFHQSHKYCLPSVV